MPATLTQPVAIERDASATDAVFNCAIVQCHFVGRASEFGHRKDGRRNTLCPACRAKQASLAGNAYHQKKHEAPRDMRALRVIERWSGFPYAEWRTAGAVKRQYALGFSFQELWTYRMRVLAARHDRCAVACARVDYRNLTARQGAA